MERPDKQKSKHLFLLLATTLENYPHHWCRFFIIELEPYTYEEFYEITVHLLDKDFARIIADAVWNTSKNLRDCVSIGKLARSEEDVNFLIDKFLCR